MPWPGNVRELTNVLERALVLTSGEVLELPELLTGRAAPTPTSIKTELPERLQDATRRCIARALTASDGRIYGPSGAAALLGVKPTTLQAKMRKLGLARAAFAGKTRHGSSVRG